MQRPIEADERNAPAIRLENLTLGYGRHAAVHHLSGAFEPGSLSALIGPNGGGKSTLLRGIAGLIKPIDGRIAIGGRATRPIAYLPQQAQIDRAFPLRVAELVGLGLWAEIGAFGAPGTQHAQRIAAALAAVRLEGFERRQIGTLSGGQLQRMLFARVVVQNSALILLDEPFAAVDERTQADLMVVIDRWHGEGRTVIAVLHDLNLVRSHFPEVLLLAREAIGWGKAGEIMTPDNLGRASGLAERWADDAPFCERVPA